MITSTVRMNLQSTGVLFTQAEDDLGHIPNRWRATIEDLCAALDAVPQDAAELLHQEREAHASTKGILAQALEQVELLEKRLVAAVEDKSVVEAGARAALQLVDEAVPRMQTLNNAMSPGWLARAEAVLGR